MVRLLLCPYVIVHSSPNSVGLHDNTHLICSKHAALFRTKLKGMDISEAEDGPSKVSLHHRRKPGMDALCQNSFLESAPASAPNQTHPQHLIVRP